MARDRVGQPTLRAGPITTAARTHHLRSAGHHVGTDAGAVWRVRPAISAGFDADAGRPYPNQPSGVAVGRRPRGVLGTATGLERPGAGIHRPTLGGAGWQYARALLLPGVRWLTPSKRPNICNPRAYPLNLSLRGAPAHPEPVEGRGNLDEAELTSTNRRRWIAPVRYCPCARDKWNGAPMITCVTAPLRCSPP